MKNGTSINNREREVIVGFIFSKIKRWFLSFSGSNAPVLSGEILIVCFSRTNNTRAIAGMIHESIGGVLVTLEVENPYPEDYNQTVDQVRREYEAGYLPALKTQIKDVGKYDIVFIGFPTWDMRMPPPMQSFLHRYDLSGKTVIPFNTHSGFGVGSSFKNVKERCPNSRVLKGFSVIGGNESEGIRLGIQDETDNEVQKVRKWLRKIKLLK